MPADLPRVRAVRTVAGLPFWSAASWAALAAVMASLLVVSAVGASGRGEGTAASLAGLPRAAAPVAGEETAYAVPAPGRLTATLRTGDLLVWSRRDRIDPGSLRRLHRVPGVRTVETVGLGSLVVEGRTLTAAAVDPATYRRWSDRTTARAGGVWSAVARGEAALTHDAAAGLGLPLGGALPWGAGPASGLLRLGAVATTVPGVDLVVNRPRGTQLGLPPGNGAVVQLAASADRVAAAEAVRRVLGRGSGVRDLAAPAADPAAQRTASLVGGDVAGAVGSFTYRWFEDGSVAPDPDWVAASIVTAEVPLLGQVTCHRVMVPRLHAALTAVVDAGLAGAIDVGQYGGCYVPRFIDRDPTQGLSLHTWGIAVDLNVAGNQLGTAGTIDRRVVEIFEQHGFAWGGHWRRPDPMHFELAVL